MPFFFRYFILNMRNAREIMRAHPRTSKFIHMMSNDVQKNIACAHKRHTVFQNYEYTDFVAIVLKRVATLCHHEFISSNVFLLV